MRHFHENYEGTKIKYGEYYFSLTLMFMEFWQRSPTSYMKSLFRFHVYRDNWVPAVDEVL